MITYLYNGQYFCECAEGSMMDLAITSAQNQWASNYIKQVVNAVKQNKPIPPNRNQSKDILIKLEYSES